MTKIKMCAFAAGLMLMGASLAQANEAVIRRVLEAKMGGVRIEGVQPASVPGLFEVRYRSSGGMQVIYTDANATHIFVGEIYQAGSGRNLTEERKRKLNAVKFESLPLDLAVKIQRGNGKRVMAMFSDPYCPACRSFERTLAQLDNVTVYVFMYPVIRPENADHSRMVWCSPDRAKAWLDLAAAPEPKLPEAQASCADPVDKVLKLGRSLGVNSTPTLIMGNGERITGGLAAADLSDLLNQPR
jgi:thiol:disulfide interchange protein DsbC